MKIRALFLGLLVLPGSFTFAQEPATKGAALKQTPPKLDKQQPRMDAYYPESLDREALVKVAFTLDEKGAVVGAQLQQGGFHDDRFVAAALKIVRKLRFAPATFNGAPVASEGVIPIRFSLANPGGRRIQGITPEFRTEAKKVQTLIENKDVAGAHFHAQWMLSEKVKLQFEFAVLQSTLAYTHARVGNVHRALLASREVTAHTGMSMEQYQPGGPLPDVSPRDFLLTKELLDQMLKLRAVLAQSQGFYLDALSAQADRQALGFVTSEDTFLKDAAKMMDVLQNAPSLRGHVRVDEEKSWDHALWFHNFAIKALKGGSLEEILLSCDGYSRTLTFSEGAEWNIPQRWNNCRVHIAASAGTEFDIMEYRDRPAPAPETPAN